MLRLLGAVRNWRNRPAPDATPEMARWMAGVDALSSGKALGPGVVLSSPNPKSLMLAIAAVPGVAGIGDSTTDAVVALVVFALVASATIAGPILGYLVGGERAEKGLAELKAGSPRTTLQ